MECIIIIYLIQCLYCFWSLSSFNGFLFNFNSIEFNSTHNFQFSHLKSPKFSQVQSWNTINLILWPLTTDGTSDCACTLFLYALRPQLFFQFFFSWKHNWKLYYGCRFQMVNMSIDLISIHTTHSIISIVDVSIHSFICHAKMMKLKRSHFPPFPCFHLLLTDISAISLIPLYLFWTIERETYRSDV